MKKSKKNQYTEEYYERGRELGISGYTNYRWLPDLTIPMCAKLMKELNATKNDLILDFGCAKGFSVKALIGLGYRCVGTDISEYAISKSPEEVKNKINLYNGEDSLNDLLTLENQALFNFILAKDVFEHIEYGKIKDLLQLLSSKSEYIFCAVPLAKDGKYIVPDYEEDITHLIREDIDWWNSLFEENKLRVIHCSYKFNGVKENWSHYPRGNGFFILESKINV